MAEATVKMADDESMTLQKAILLYGGNRVAYATMHDISLGRSNAAPILKQGVPLTVDVLGKLMRSLGQSAQIGAFLPENLLSVGYSSVVWWLKPEKRRVYFNCTPGNIIGNESALVPCPGLVFAANDSGWSVFAVKGNKRPDVDAQLFQAPFFNVWASGSICVGSANIPKDYSAESTRLWDKAFFESAFSHPNVHAPQKLVEYKGGAYKFWRDMLDGAFQKFPERVLVDAGNTLGGLIKSVTEGQR